MPTRRFQELAPEKRERIISESIAEFARYGYENSSTNRITAASGISKGSLFKYFEGKEELYLYVLELASGEMVADLGAAAEGLSSDIFALAAEYSALEFEWYAAHPEKARLIIRAFTRSDSDIYRRVAEKFSGADEDIYYSLLENIDTDRFVYDRGKTIDIVKWFLKGFNEDFRERLCCGEETDTEQLKNEYIAALTGHMEILRAALVR